MIIRIMGEGQFRFSTAEVADDLEPLDQALEAALEADEGVEDALDALLDAVRNGDPVGDEELISSDIVLPAADSTPDEIREMLTDEGLIPDM